MTEPPKQSAAPGSLILGLAAAVILALGVGVLVYNRQQPPPPAPEPIAAPEPSAPGEKDQPGAAPTTPETSSGAPAPAAGAKAAGGSGGPRGPAGKPVDLGGSRGTAGAPPPLSAQAMLRRSFVASRSASENIKGVSKDLSGFETRKSQDVTVKRAPQVDGRLEFHTSPLRVKPGDKFQVRVSFVNEGKRTIELKEVTVTAKVNGQQQTSAVKPLVRKIASRQNEVIHEIKGTWDRSVQSWGLEVRVLSDRLDMYRNELSWK